MVRAEGCHSSFTFTNWQKAFVPSEYIMDRPQINYDSRMGCVISLCVCACVRVTPHHHLNPLHSVFNYFAGLFSKASQDKLSSIVVFESQCTAQRKGRG